LAACQGVAAEPAPAGIFGYADPVPEPGRWRVRTSVYYMPYFPQ
jgi:hypothetical protein